MLTKKACRLEDTVITEVLRQAPYETAEFRRQLVNRVMLMIIEDGDSDDLPEKVTRALKEARRDD
jgi:hypothetical protein